MRSFSQVITCSIEVLSLSNFILKSSKRTKPILVFSNNGRITQPAFHPPVIFRQEVELVYNQSWRATTRRHKRLSWRKSLQYVEKTHKRFQLNRDIIIQPRPVALSALKRTSCWAFGPRVSQQRRDTTSFWLLDRHWTTAGKLREPEETRSRGLHPSTNKVSWTSCIQLDSHWWEWAGVCKLWSPSFKLKRISVRALLVLKITPVIFKINYSSCKFTIAYKSPNRNIFLFTVSTFFNNKHLINKHI